MGAIENRRKNRAFLDDLLVPGSTTSKTAAELTNDYIRMRRMETCFADKVIPVKQTDPNEIQRQFNTDRPMTMHEREPFGPGAVSVPLGGLSPATYIFEGSVFPCYYDRIQTKKLEKDVEELYPYNYDIRQLLSDQTTLYVDKEKDTRFIAMMNALCGSATTDRSPYSGEQHYYEIADMGREAVVDATQFMPSMKPMLVPRTALLNRKTFAQIWKWGQEEVGGTLSEEMLRKGVYDVEFMGLKWVVTDKWDIVNNGEIFMFAEPEALGVNRVLTDLTMIVKRDGPVLSWYSYMTAGMAIGNVGGVIKVKVTSMS